MGFALASASGSEAFSIYHSATVGGLKSFRKHLAFGRLAMPVISMCSPKGGAGKTTTSVLVATVLADQGESVTIIDADPNKAVMRWATRPGVPKTLTVVNADADSLIDRIDEASAKSRFVIVDLEGTKNLVVSYAIQKSNLVVIPVKGSQLDAELATEQISMVKMQERVAGRAIPYAMVFTQTRPPLSPKTQRFIEAQFAQLGAPIFDTQLVDREAFRAMFSFGGSLAGLISPVTKSRFFSFASGLQRR
jgi:chromosome partitioning protein